MIGSNFDYSLSFRKFSHYRQRVYIYIRGFLFIHVVYLRIHNHMCAYTYTYIHKYIFSVGIERSEARGGFPFKIWVTSNQFDQIVCPLALFNRLPHRHRLPSNLGSNVLSQLLPNRSGARSIRNSEKIGKVSSRQATTVMKLIEAMCVRATLELKGVGKLKKKKKNFLLPTESINASGLTPISSSV